MKKKFLKNIIMGVMVLSIATTFGQIEAKAATTNSIQTNGWHQIGNDWHYLKDNNNLTGWIQDNGTWYYLYADGTMAFNTMIGDSYVNESGKLTTPPKKEDNKMLYKDAVTKAITYALGKYDYVTPVKFEDGEMKIDGNSDIGYIAQEDKDNSSSELMFSTKPVTNENAKDFNSIFKDKWIVAKASLNKDGSYSITGQYYSTRICRGRVAMTYDTNATCQADDKSCIIVNPDGNVKIKGQVVKR